MFCCDIEEIVIFLISLFSFFKFFLVLNVVLLFVGKFMVVMFCLSNVVVFVSFDLMVMVMDNFIFGDKEVIVKDCIGCLFVFSL